MTEVRPVTGKISAIKAGWILFVLLAIWLTFLALPSPREGAQEIPAPENVPGLELRAVGLPDNPDLDGLPEIFSIWADQAEWKDGRTRFAYWHPVMKTYTYFFEAIRADGRVRFKEISEPHDQGFHWDHSLSDDCPIRFYTSVNERVPKKEREPMPPSILPPPVANYGKVEIDVSAPKIVPPPVPNPVTVPTH